MKIIFFGSAGFGEKSFARLIDSGYDIAALVTQPDRPKGRGKKIEFSSIKCLAAEHGIRVLQPEKASETDFIDIIEAIGADVFVTASYGNFLPERLLNIPPMGCINVHGSLLPDLRGAAPIQWAVIRGYKTTGVTTMLTDIGMDSGDILLTSKADISDGMTYGELYEKLAEQGADLLIETLKRFAAGEIVPIPQNAEKATFAPMIKKEQGKLDFSKSAQEISNLIRGMNPAPGAYTFIDGSRIKVWKSEIYNGEVPDLPPGTYFKGNGKTINIAVSDGAISLCEVQGESGKKMDAEAYLRGHVICEGKVLGGEII